jgi:cytochrome c-type biogenesis protein CcmH/NrfG
MEARFRLGDCRLAEGNLKEARRVWQDLLAKHPAHEAWSSVQRNIIQTEYELGAEAYRAKRYAEAREIWTFVPTPAPPALG